MREFPDTQKALEKMADDAVDAILAGLKKAYALGRQDECDLVAACLV